MDVIACLERYVSKLGYGGEIVMDGVNVSTRSRGAITEDFRLLRKELTDKYFAKVVELTEDCLTHKNETLLQKRLGEVALAIGRELKAAKFTYNLAENAMSILERICQNVINRFRNAKQDMAEFLQNNNFQRLVSVGKEQAAALEAIKNAHRKKQSRIQKICIYANTR